MFSQTNKFSHIFLKLLLKSTRGGVRIQVLIWGRKPNCPFLQTDSLADTLVLQKIVVSPSQNRTLLFLVSNFCSFFPIFYEKVRLLFQKKSNFSKKQDKYETTTSFLLNVCEKV